MRSKSDEKLTRKPGTNPRPSPMILRLVTRGELQPKSMESAETPQRALTNQSLRSHWNDNDDDPGPSAA